LWRGIGDHVRPHLACIISQVGKYLVPGVSDQPAGINELDSSPIASTRAVFDDEAGIEASDLTMDGIDRLRPEVYEQLAANADETLFMKVHDACTFVDKDTPLFPEKTTTGVIYFIRNPFDVGGSFAHHSGWDYDTAITRMGDEKYALCSKPKRPHNQLRQRILSWSAHVLSWVDTSGLPLCVLRYEDMKLNQVDTFEKAVRFSGLEYGREEILKALDLSSFEELQCQEKEDGFKEKSPKSEMFFR
jgi:hypothetical protein